MCDNKQKNIIDNNFLINFINIYKSDNENINDNLLSDLLNIFWNNIDYNKYNFYIAKNHINLLNIFLIFDSIKLYDVKYDIYVKTQKNITNIFNEIEKIENNVDYIKFNIEKNINIEK